MKIQECSQNIGSDSPVQSPIKINNNLLLTRPDDRYELSNNKSIFHSMLQVSLTEKQMLSHPMIKQIIQKSTKKTVQHKNINLIPAQTQLYKIPQDFDRKQYDFDCIPPNNTNYQSTSSKKVTQINRRLSKSKNLSQRIQQISESNKNIKIKNDIRNRTSSASDKRVSVSGLVSYNFNSVNARRSLGNIPDSPEQQALTKKINNIRNKNSLHRTRQASIIRRKPNKSSILRQSVSNAAACDFHMPTQKFLKVLIDEKDKDEMIFGEKMEKLNCIKEYMEKQKVQYQQAKFIVEAIQSAQKKQPNKKKKRQQYIIDDDAQIEKRKMILKKKRVMPKHLYFTE